MGEEDCQTEADGLGGEQEENGGGAEGKVGEGEEGGVKELDRVEAVMPAALAPQKGSLARSSYYGDFLHSIGGSTLRMFFATASALRLPSSRSSAHSRVIHAFACMSKTQPTSPTSVTAEKSRR